MTTALFTHASSLRHVTPVGHPERGDRIRAISQVLASPHFNELVRREAPIGHDKDILLAHAPDHLERIRSVAPEEGFEYLDPDTAMSPGSLEAALHAVGAAIAAVDVVFEGEADNAFCALRQTGHHAESRRATVCCLLHNTAIAAQSALRL